MGAPHDLVAEASYHREMVSQDSDLEKDKEEEDLGFVTTCFCLSDF